MQNNLSYSQRALHCTNLTAQKLFLLMAEKETNLSVSLDVTHKEQFLHLADLLGPEICVLKTHIDILEDFDPTLIQELTRLANKHQFLIFEDRKFADIGNTVQSQYGGGIYRMADWADIVNAHTLPGPGIIEGLKSVGLNKGRGLLLLAQMSAKPNLFDDKYTQASVAMAEQHPDFVIGFISMGKLSDNPAWIYLTPGVHMTSGGDKLGQQYATPEQAILERGTDIIIVGRGIYEAENPLASAQAYRKAGWEAYEQRVVG
jgi:uridine monophosphate synthetase